MGIIIFFSVIVYIICFQIVYKCLFDKNGKLDCDIQRPYVAILLCIFAPITICGFLLSMIIVLIIQAWDIVCYVQKMKKKR